MKIILLEQVEVGAHMKKGIAKKKRSLVSSHHDRIILPQMSPVLVLISQCSNTRKLLLLSSLPS